MKCNVSATACLAGALLQTPACESPAPRALPKPEVSLTLPPASATDPVVATVAAVAIHASHVAAQMRGGQSARAALETLIDLEVLLARAKTRRLDEGREADDRKKLILAQGFLRKDFEPATVSGMVPVADLKFQYEQRKQGYVHPLLKHVTILDLLVGGKSVAEGLAQAKELAALIAARRDWNEEEFAGLAQEAKWRQRNLRVARVFQHENGPYSPVFAKAVMTLPVGQVSAMVKDGDGYHIALVTGELAARDTGFDEAREELAFLLQPAWQTHRFFELGARLMQVAGVQIYPQRLRREGAP